MRARRSMWSGRLWRGALALALPGALAAQTFELAEATIADAHSAMDP